MTQTLKVGVVPEHFSVALVFAKEKYGADVTFVEIKEGTGRLIESLNRGDIDVAVGLTEALVAGLLRGEQGYRIAGSYVASPLCWVISAGAEADMSVARLETGCIGISRYGSGSHVMPFVLANRQGWTGMPRFQVLNNFKTLRDGVNDGRADAFMWERFTSKKYHDAGEIKEIGEIFTPWPSWLIVATPATLKNESMGDFLNKVNQGIGYFRQHPDEAVEWISTHLDYSAKDARAWLKTVTFSSDAHAVDKAMIEQTVSVLKSANVTSSEQALAIEDMYVRV